MVFGPFRPYPPSPLGATPREPLRQIYFLQTYKMQRHHRSDVDVQKPDVHGGSHITLPAGQGYKKGDTRRAFLCLSLIFFVAALALGVTYLNFPEVSEADRTHIKLPKDIEDAKQLGRVLSHYKDQYFYQVLGGYFATYIFLQTFAIPGSIFLSIISGFLFPFPLALSMVCLCSAMGACFCYLLSYLLGRTLVQKYIPERAAKWSAQIDKHRGNLLFYIIFLRVTPFLPNWFINIASPVLNVDMLPFFLGTFLGVAPPSFVAIQAGTTLQQLTSSSDTVTWRSIALLALFAALSLLPTLFKRKLEKKMD